jgi:Tol biopolymer transport system component
MEFAVPTRGESRLTSNSKNNGYPVWHGSQIAFASDRDGSFGVYQQEKNGVTPAQLLDKDGGYPLDWSQSKGALL